MSVDIAAIQMADHGVSKVENEKLKSLNIHLIHNFDIIFCNIFKICYVVMKREDKLINFSIKILI